MALDTTDPMVGEKIGAPTGTLAMPYLLNFTQGAGELTVVHRLDVCMGGDQKRRSNQVEQYCMYRERVRDDRRKIHNLKR